MLSYRIEVASYEHLGAARGVMLDTVYRDFGSGYVPRWHGDIIDLEAAYLRPERHTLLVAVDERDGAVAATAALDSRGPASPPNPAWIAERYPSGRTAQLRRVYVRPEHRRRGLARRLVGELLRFAAADGGYDTAYLHTDPAVEGAEAFWRSLARVVWDERESGAEPEAGAAGLPGPGAAGSGVVHFELALASTSTPTSTPTSGPAPALG